MGSVERRVLIIGLDGMRPDLYDPQKMPALAGLVARGTRFPDHHAVYPTHTRVNISSLATGTTPGRHGIVANVFRLPDDGFGIVDTSNDEHLRRLDSAAAGPALLAPALGDILEGHDERVAVAATSSAGACILWTRNQPYRVVNVNSHFDRADLLSLREKLGPVPPRGNSFEDRLERQMYAARAVTDIFLHDDDCRVIVMWLNEPDSSLHGFGLGAPQVDDALRIADQAIGHVLDALDQSGRRDQFDVIVMSDHGHSTVLHHRSLGEYLDRARRELELDGLELATASDFIYLTDKPRLRQLSKLVRWIQEQPWTGAVFGSGPYGDLGGVLALEALWGDAVPGDRAPALAVSPAWSDAPNEFGVPGTVAALTEQVALRSTHGSASPFDLHAFLVASGPDFHEGVTTGLPSGAVDLAPTVLQLLGRARPEAMDGRVLWEGFREPAGEPGEHRQTRTASCVLHEDGFNPVIVQERVGDTTYVDHVTNGHQG